MLAIGSLQPHSLDAIPNEIYYEIFSKLKPKNWYSASLVCKLWDSNIREVARDKLNREINQIVKEAKILEKDFCLSSSNLYAGIIKFQLEFFNGKYFDLCNKHYSTCKILNGWTQREIDFWKERYQFLIQQREYELAAEIAEHHLNINHVYLELIHIFEIKLFKNIMNKITIHYLSEFKYLEKTIFCLIKNQKYERLKICLNKVNEFLFFRRIFLKNKFFEYKIIISSIIAGIYDLHIKLLIKNPKYSWEFFNLWCELSYNRKKWRKNLEIGSPPIFGSGK